MPWTRPQLGRQEGGGAGDGEGGPQGGRGGEAEGGGGGGRRPEGKVEALRKRGDDLQQRLGLAEAQVRSLTSTLSAPFTAQQGLGPPVVHSQGSGSSSASQ